MSLSHIDLAAAIAVDMAEVVKFPYISGLFGSPPYAPTESIQQELLLAAREGFIRSPAPSPSDVDISCALVAGVPRDPRLRSGYGARLPEPSSTSPLPSPHSPGVFTGPYGDVYYTPTSPGAGPFASAQDRTPPYTFGGYQRALGPLDAAPPGLVAGNPVVPTYVPKLEPGLLAGAVVLPEPTLEATAAAPAAVMLAPALEGPATFMDRVLAAADPPLLPSSFTVARCSFTGCTVVFGHNMEPPCPAAE